MPDPVSLLRKEIAAVKAGVLKGAERAIDSAVKPLGTDVKQLKKGVEDLLSFRDEVKKKIFGDLKGELAQLQAQVHSLEARLSAYETQMEVLRKAVAQAAKKK